MDSGGCKLAHYNPVMRSIAIVAAAILASLASALIAAHPDTAVQASSTLAEAGRRRPITATDLLSAQRVSDPQLSPDGSRVVYSVAVPDRTANRMARDVWMVSMANGQARAATTTGRDSGAR